MLPLCSASLNEFPSQISCCLTYFFLTVPRVFCKILFYLFLDRGKGREKERERNFKVWLPLVHLQLGICSATQACALTGNQTRDPLVCRPVLSPLGYTSQGNIFIRIRLQKTSKTQQWGKSYADLKWKLCSPDPSILLQRVKFSSFLWTSRIPMCRSSIVVLSTHYPLSYWWTLGLLPYLGNCK